MPVDYPQVEWDTRVAASCRRLAEIACREDLDSGEDWTTNWLVPVEARATARIVARKLGVMAGLPTVGIVVEVFGADVRCDAQVGDGASIAAGDCVAVLSGCARDLLTIERTVLNFLGRMSGVATLTRQFVDAVAGTQAKIYDTRKTTPGWRLLEKYAVRQGGGCNHRLGLSEAVMLKDNHVALAGEIGLDIAGAVERFRGILSAKRPDMVLEVEVDNLDQLRQVLVRRPDIVLLDNMKPEILRQAVAIRDELAPGVVLEASGGVKLSTVAAIAATGVDRISAGSLTHSAVNFDFGLDWGITQSASSSAGSAEPA